MRIKRISCKMLLQEIYKRAIETVLKNKKEEIKNRIDLINRGEVPEGYKKVHGYIIPNDWQITRFNKIFERITKKNDVGCKNVLTISAQYGLINQQEFFKKSIASADTSNYFLLNKNDFAYNKSYSAGYPFGTIKKMKLYEQGIVSPLYICFRAKPKLMNIDYIEQYFDANKFNSEILAIAQEGARNHGLLNMSIDDFFNCNIVKPSQQEQEKIVKILNCCDKVIELKEKLICEEIKKNINCSRKVLKKLKGDTVEIGEILDYEQPTKYIVKNQYKNKQNEEDIPVLTANKAFIKSYTNEKFGIYDNLPVIIFDDFTVENKYVTFPFKVQSSAMKILKPKNPNINLLFVYKSMQLLKFKANDHKRYYLSEYQYMPINLPDIETQNRTVEILSKIDRKIELLQQELEQYKQLKKSFSQLLLTGIVRTVEVDCEN